jgi:4-carboxymuconolactone decarboxylase
MDETRLERGRAIRAEVLGPEYVATRAAIVTTDPVILNWQQYLAEEGWGGVWSRDGLARKYRSLITITALTAGGKSHELGLHLVGAMRNGWSRDELGEALIHMSSYVGYPSVVEAFRVLESVFADNPDLNPEKSE